MDVFADELVCCEREFGIFGDGDGELIVDVRSEVRRLLFGYRLLEEFSRVSESGSACFRYALVGRPIGLVFGLVLGFRGVLVATR